jgi:hypothetical protein
LSKSLSSVTKRDVGVYSSGDVPEYLAIGGGAFLKTSDLKFRAWDPDET